MPTRLSCLRLAVLIAWAGWMSVLTAPAAAAPPDWHNEAARFLESLRREDGGYAWPDQAESHLTPTYAAIGSYKLLGMNAPEPAQAAAFLRTHHPQRAKKPERALHQFDHEQIQSLLWLGEEPGPAFTKLATDWTGPVPYMARYEVHSYPAFQQEIACLLSRELLKLPTDLPDYAKYIEDRRRDNGSYNNTKPGDDGSDGHVINTLWALRGLQALGQPVEKKAELVKWLQSCQRPDGHFSHAPNPEIGGKSNDIIYTWAAVAALRLLDQKPIDTHGCVTFTRTLYNADGGFGDRPGWPSNALATFYALQVLSDLDALSGGIPRRPPTILCEAQPLPADLRVFSTQIQAPGVGSPADAVEIARALKIHLWGAKNAKPGWIERAQTIADERKVPVKFFVANEEYNTFFSVPGMGTYSHLSDVIAPAGVDFGASLAGNSPLPTWKHFVENRVVPLEKAGGRNVYQFNENEPLARMLLDESVDSGRAFAAISTFHFGNPDFTNSSPYLWHFQHKLPMVALQDNHAAEPWLALDTLQGFRTLFLAKEPTWDGFMTAIKNNWILSVRHDEVSGGRTWVHGATGDVRERFLEQRDDWRWWTETHDKASREVPMVTVAAIRATDPFEVGKPEKGIALRVRRRWQTTTQGLPKSPLAELVSVSVDGKPVETTLVRVPPAAKGRNAPAGIADEYYVATLSDLPPGKHQATAVVRPVSRPNQVLKTTIEFEND